ncbi:ferredoxin [Croceibacterium sp. TMG7-5b_MA50]|uniref:(2Fe-2S)-binding protein n=1 Tax=Croceibacterium sp. TMG7-5b_MA50 TaxID=3121290 RepID=UPI003221B8AE
MYICICNAIRECEFRTAALGAGCDASGVYQRLGKRPQCGQCLDDAEDMLEEYRAAACQQKVAA